MIQGPHDIQIEQELLGCLLIYNKSYSLVSNIIRPEHFFEPLHQAIFDICSKLITMGKPATPTTVKSFIAEDFAIGDMTISKYLAKLAASATPMVSVAEFARIIRNLADYRSIIGVVELAASVKGIDSDPTQAAVEAISALDTIISGRSIVESPSLTIAASVVRSMDAAAKAYQNDGAISGLSYGLKDLDVKTGGLHRGELTLLAGRPGMMKTGLALNFVRSLCNAEYRGQFFSLEMGDVLLTQRMISDLIFEQSAEVPYSRIRRGEITEKEFYTIRNAAESLAKFPLQIEQQGAATLAEIGTKARRLQRKDGLDFIVVDYIGLMGVADRYRGNRVSEIAELSAGLIKLAKDLNVAMLVLCQLSRGVESREDKRPRLSDLRESGALEQDASVVIMLYREAYYLQNREPRPGTPQYIEWQEEMMRCWNLIDIQIEKNRNGPTGTVQAYVNPAVNAVRDLSFESLPERKTA